MTTTTNTSHWPRVTGYAVTVRGTVLCFALVGDHGDAARCLETCLDYARAIGGSVTIWPEQRPERLRQPRMALSSPQPSAQCPAAGIKPGATVGIAYRAETIAAGIPSHSSSLGGNESASACFSLEAQAPGPAPIFAVTIRGTVLCFVRVGEHGDASQCRSTCREYAAAIRGSVVRIDAKTLAARADP